MNTTRPQRPARRAPRVGLAAALLAGVLFCAYGFLASYELGPVTAWHVGYGALGLAALAGLLRTLLGIFRGRDGACPVSSGRDHP